MWICLYSGTYDLETFPIDPHILIGFHATMSHPNRSFIQRILRGPCAWPYTFLSIASMAESLVSAVAACVVGLRLWMAAVWQATSCLSSSEPVKGLCDECSYIQGVAYAVAFSLLHE